MNVRTDRGLATGGQSPDRNERRATRWWAPAASVASVLIVAAVAGIPQGPLQADGPPGTGPLLPFRWLARGTGLTSLSPTSRAAAAFVALGLAGAAFLFAVSEAWAGRLGLRLAIALGIGFHVIPVALPVLSSSDVYQYAMYGRMLGVHDANPYVVTPDRFPSDPLFHSLGLQWHHTTSVYGPALIRLSALLARQIGDPPHLILAFKVLAGVAGVLAMLLAAAVANRVWPTRGAVAAVLLGWNPVVLFNGVGGGHVDTLLALLVIGALFLVVRGEGASSAGEPWLRLGATAALTLAALVKVPLAIPLVLAVAGAAHAAGRGRRLWVLMWHAVVVVGVAAIVAWPFVQRSNPTLGTASLSSISTFLAPSTFVRFLIGAVIGGSTSRFAHAVWIAARDGFFLAVLVAFAGLVRSVLARPAPLDAGEGGATWGWGLLVACLGATTFFPWYLIWVLPVLWLLPRWPRLGVVAACAVLPLSGAIATPARTPGLYNTMLQLGTHLAAPALLVLFFVVLREMFRRLRAGDSLVGNGESEAPARRGTPERQAGEGEVVRGR